MAHIPSNECVLSKRKKKNPFLQVLIGPVLHNQDPTINPAQPAATTLHCKLASRSAVEAAATTFVVRRTSTAEGKGATAPEAAADAAADAAAATPVADAGAAAAPASSAFVATSATEEGPATAQGGGLAGATSSAAATLAATLTGGAAATISADSAEAVATPAAAAAAAATCATTAAAGAVDAIAAVADSRQQPSSQAEQFTAARLNEQVTFSSSLFAHCLDHQLQHHQ